MEENQTYDEIVPTPNENPWKDIISHGRNRSEKLDARTQLVFQVLRDKLEDKTEVQDKSDIEIKLEKSELHLEELKQFGNELVNNIKSANEKHQLLQSQHKHSKEIELQEQLRKERELSLGQFDEISKKWREMNSLKEPMAIHEEMQRQRENIGNLMASKDELIAQCQQELKQINNKYYEDLDNQAIDICVLVERVDHQVKLLKKSYRTSLNELQNTIEIEKQKKIQAAQEKWNMLYEHLTTSEERKMELVKEKQKFYAQELEDIRNKQEEISRTTKIRLEKDAETLELEIRKTQANILMNSEKIDYNYQVLQKRNDENIIINNQQKRRVGKLNESIVVLKKKLAEIKGNNRMVMKKLTLDIQKLHSGINDLQTKSESFRKNNAIKLAKVWEINFKEVKQLVSRVLEIDRILYEQQLARKWMPPNLDLEKLDYLREREASDKTNTLEVDSKKMVKPLTKATDPSQLHDILHKISDRAGFLVEEKVLQILGPYTDNDQCLVKLANIFSALNITNFTVVESLIKYFEPYSWCPNCSSGVKADSLKTLYSFKRHSNNMSNTLDEKSDDPNGRTADLLDTECENHVPCMEPTLVLTALNDFISGELNALDKSSGTRKFNKTSQADLLQLHEDDITSYWQQFSSYMSEEQQSVWKSIEHGLNHYLEVLKKRAQIDSDCVFLQKQNFELKHLLHKL